MRLAIYHNHPPGGAARSFHELGKILARRHEVEVFTLSSSAEAALPSSDYAREVHVFPFALVPPIRFGFYLSEWRHARDLSALQRVNEGVAASIDAGGFDAVLVSVCRYAQAPPLLEYLRTPAAYYCHEPPRRFIDDFCRPEAVQMAPYQRLRHLVHAPARNLSERRWQQADRQAVLAATQVLTNSEYTRGRIQDYYGRDASVCYLGVDACRFPVATRNGDYVLCVSAIENHKGIDFLIRALALIEPGVRPRLLVIGSSGNPALSKQLRALAAANDVDLELRFSATEAELLQAYAGARAFVFAARLEPFGLVVLEAMAAGLPIVAVGEGGVLESLQESSSGLLTPRHEPTFAQALTTALQDATVAASLSREAREHALEDWTWDAAAARIEGHMERAVVIPALGSA